MKHLGLVLIVAFLLVTVGAAPAAAATGPCGSSYIVRWGDTLNSIALRCSTSVSALRAANPTILSPDRIYAGQRLNMPGGGQPPQPGPDTYVVVRGDTLRSIALRFHTTIEALLRANPAIHDRDHISAGMIIRIPKAAPEPPPQPEPPSFTQVQIPLVATDTAGPVGCGDTIILVKRSVPATTEPLTTAVKQLLSLHTQYYGQSGLYNPLYQSNLAVQSVTIQNGQAVIRLSGSLRLGGECDDPRVAAQFDAIGRQFSTVQKVQVYINNKPLQQLLGGKGSA
jgi:LysM repeat protein